MLSKFDLKPGIDFKEFKINYANFIDAVRASNLIEGAGPIGQRVKNTPMDTAGENEPQYFSIMSFKDRTQLDAAYENFLNAEETLEAHSTHITINKAVENAIFTCWQDEE
jgi:hypothetical protein